MKTESMRKNYVLLFSYIAISLGAICQGEFNKCYFGTVGIDFSDFQPQILTNSQMSGFESPASICDSMGNLLFYSNGGNNPTGSDTNMGVWNANHEIMENGILGDSSGCLSSSHGAVAFPISVESDSSTTARKLYYLFTRDCIESSFTSPRFNSGLTYCLIDMNENGGLGKVIKKNKTVIPFNEDGTISTGHEPLSVVLHENNKDWWLFSYNNDSIYSLKITPTSIGEYRSYDTGVGPIIISPRRDKLIAGKKLYDFDALTGDLSLRETFNNYSAAFSSNGSKLYLVENSTIKQYNMDVQDISTSQVIIGSIDDLNSLYLAPDHKIYLFGLNRLELPGRIDCPNEHGLNCALNLNAIYLEGKSSGVFTNIPANYLFKERTSCVASNKEIIISKKNITIYPNPAKEVINFNGLEDKLFSVEVLSSCGKVVIAKKDIKNNSLNISSLMSGIYFIYIYGKKDIVKKLVIE